MGSLNGGLEPGRYAVRIGAERARASAMQWREHVKRKSKSKSKSKCNRNRKSKCNRNRKSNYNYRGPSLRSG